MPGLFPKSLTLTRRAIPHPHKAARCYAIASNSLSYMPNDNPRLHHFKGAYSRISEELVQELRRENVPKEVLTWYRNNLECNILCGKLHRGMTVVDTVEILKRRPLSEAEFLKAAALGWAVELLSVYSRVNDSTPNASLTHRNQSSWFLGADFGISAVNNARMPTFSAYRVIKSHFRGEPYYLSLVEHFLEDGWQTRVSRFMDSPRKAEYGADALSYKSKKHALSETWIKGYAHYFPVACAMYMCGIPDTPYIPSKNPSQPLESPYDVARTIMPLLGEYDQAQNDFLDFAAKPEDIRRIGGTGITNKNSWCVKTAIQRATPAQRQILDEYCRDERGSDGSELKLRAVLEEIGIREKYAEYEQQMMKLIREHIARVPGLAQEGALRKELFEKLLDKLILKRID